MFVVTMPNGAKFSFVTQRDAAEFVSFMFRISKGESIGWIEQA